jgi:hypothetical protein
VVLGGGRWQGRRRCCWVVAGGARAATVGARELAPVAGGGGLW